MEIYLGNILFVYFFKYCVIESLSCTMNLNHFYSVLLKFILLFKKNKKYIPVLFNLSGCRIVFLFRAHEQEIYVLLEKFVPFVLTRSVRLMIQILSRRVLLRISRVGITHLKQCVIRFQYSASKVSCVIIVCRINCERILKETISSLKSLLE